MTFREWYNKLGDQTCDHEGLERYLSNLMFLAWQEGYEQGERETEDCHEQNDTRST